MKKLGKTIKSILLEYPNTRDNDNQLILHVWMRAKPSLNDDKFLYFASDFATNKLQSTESICRARRLVQEKYPNTRGHKYAKRHRIAEQIKNGIKQIKSEI